MVDGGFTGPVVAINPNADGDVAGLPCYPSLKEAPGPIDLVIIATPADSVVDVVHDAAAARVHSLVVVSSGFGESGPEGWAAQVALLRSADELIATPAGLSFILRLLIALLIGGGVTFGVFVFFRRAIGNAALPEKKAILQSAQIETFSWRATTFSFTNDAFTERFIDLNEPFLMEI